MLALSALLAVAIPQTALAKGRIMSARLCDPTACHPISSQGDLAALTGAFRATEGVSPVLAPSLQGYLRIRTAPEGAVVGNRRLYYVPGEGLVASAGSWVKLSSSLASHLYALADGMTLFRPTLAQISVGGHRVGARASVAALFGPMDAVKTPPTDIFDSPSYRITIRSNPRSPWSDSDHGPISYFPRYSLIERGMWVWFRAPAGLDGQLRQAVGWQPPPRPASSRSNQGYVIAAAVTAALVGLIALAHRRRHIGRAVTT
jgi:hypothetical protein